MLKRYPELREFSARVVVRKFGQITLPKVLRNKLNIGADGNVEILIIALPIEMKVILPKAHKD